MPGVLSAAEPVGTAPKDKTSPPAVAEAKPDKAAVRKPPLDKGMATADIIKFYGQPREIVPLKSPDPATKAERWTYRRKSNEEITEQISLNKPEVYQFTSRTSNGQTVIQTTSIATPLIKPKLIVTYQVTVLLIVNGRLELAKQWEQKEENY